MVMRVLGPFGGIICCIIEVAFDMLECDVLEERGFEAWRSAAVTR